MKYKCLLIDHDDTTVDSTPTIHHLAHIEQMRRLKREEQALSLEDWFQINYKPGLAVYYQEILKLTKSEVQLAYETWREFTTRKTPPFFAGILELFKEYRQAGGRIIVVSHSEPDIIKRHYIEQKELPGFEPDLIIGWTGDRQKNKPHIWPVEEVKRRYSAGLDEMIMVDDLLPGIEMANKAGIHSFGVGWSHKIPELQEDMQKKATYYETEILKLKKLVLN